MTRPILYGINSRTNSILKGGSKKISNKDEIGINSKDGLLVFYHPLCPACKEIKPIITELKKDYPEAIIQTIDVSDYSGQSIANVMNIEYIPTIMPIKNNRLLHNIAIIGAQNEQKLRDFACSEANMCSSDKPKKSSKKKDSSKENEKKKKTNKSKTPKSKK